MKVIFNFDAINQYVICLDFYCLAYMTLKHPVNKSLVGCLYVLEFEWYNCVIV